MVQQDANSRVWQRETYELSPSGEITTNTQSYTELASGLNFLDASGQYVPSKEEIDIQPDGTASATQGQHKVYFPIDIYSGEIEMVTPDGVILKSQPVGLSYDDGSNTVFIAVLTNSVGQLLGDNQVIYTNAFAGVDADLIYTYTRSGLEQDVVIHEQLVSPDAVGLIAANSCLQVLTEFLSSPQPVVTETELPPQGGMTLTDESLDFGTMKMVQGRAFLLGTNSPLVRVSKSWMNVSGRQILVEQVPVMALADELSALPVGQQAKATPGLAGQTFARAVAPSAQARVAALLGKIGLPVASIHRSKAIFMTKAVPGRSNKGLVMDYVALTGTMTNYAFRGDTTYYISGGLGLSGTNTIEGGSVLKFGAVGITVGSYSGGCLISTANANRMAVLTVTNDNSVGQIIAGSSGNPTNGGLPHLVLDLTSEPSVLSYLRFSFAGVQQWSEGSSYTGISPIRNCQFISCPVAIGLGPYDNLNTLNQGLYNVLFSKCGTNVQNLSIYYDGDISVSAQNVTVDQAGVLLQTWSGDTYATGSGFKNCILTGVTHQIFTSDYPAGYKNFSNTNFCYIASTNTGIYQSAGAGNYYLATNSLRSCGTTSLDATWLAQLRQKTTWPPLFLTNQLITTNLTLTPQALRDNASPPDFGFHYDPIDYIVDNSTVSNAIITLTNGTAIATYNETGLNLADNSTILSQGTATAPNWFARYQSVQEQSISLGGTNNNNGVAVYPSYTSAKPKGTYQFTKFTCPANGGIHLYDYSTSSYTNLNVQECEFWGGSNVLGGASGTTLLFDNNLFARSCITATGGGILSFTNNLVWGTTFVQLNPSGVVWSAFNNAFDSSTIANSTLTNGYNAYLNYTNYLVRQIPPTSFPPIVLLTRQVI